MFNCPVTGIPVATGIPEAFLSECEDKNAPLPSMPRWSTRRGGTEILRRRNLLAINQLLAR